MQQQQRQTSGPGPGPGSGSSAEPNRGLARFRSAPASWFDTLLQDDEPLTQNQCLAPLPGNGSTTPVATTSANFGSSETVVDAALLETGVSGPGFGFLRQNSSPAEFLAQINSPGSDEYLSSFGISGDYDYLSLLDIPANKRARDSESEQESATHSSAKFSAQLKGEQGVGLPGGSGTFSDMEMEKLFEDSVPYRVRAKRGYATHPRSIAERVRRTRISDRIRKLQELVPNMDKQTNTADMLEEAVEYVKFLQKQIQELSEHQTGCKCLSKD
ncbi:hypothetical protein HHK36_004447 [Tetracentron sinense]|uniref:BHLH domain-containing protein n=1 Tax=Tetracentron sinense TaxID=13715 RepID=A0A835DT76_TETSI|nr:hypothetical protein HHK36_004447 [Tetracentron sinense]